MGGHFKLGNYENIYNDIITTVTESNYVKVSLTLWSRKWTFK